MMVCYARPASWLAAIVIVSWLAFARPVSHHFGTAAVMTAVGTACAAVAAALAFAVFMSARRRRAAAGGCVSCRFRCQHAMTGQGRRVRLVTIANLRPAGPDRPAAVPAGVPDAPSWPDRPVLRASQVSDRAPSA